MRTILTLVIMAMCVGGMSGTAIAQQKEYRIASTNTSWDARIDEAPERQKQYKTIYKREAYGAFLGNKCVEESTRNMGFNYELVPKQGPGRKTAVAVFLHNSGTRFLLMFKNGPFWQLRLRKQIDACRIKTGDYIGWNYKPKFHSVLPDKTPAAGQ
jgi:hypothetical protein